MSTEPNNSNGVDDAQAKGAAGAVVGGEGPATTADLRREIAELKAELAELKAELIKVSNKSKAVPLAFRTDFKLHPDFALKVQAQFLTLQEEFLRTLERITGELAEKNVYHSPNNAKAHVLGFIDKVLGSHCVKTGDIEMFSKYWKELDTALWPSKYPVNERPF